MRRRTIRTGYLDLSAADVRIAIKFWLEEVHALHCNKINHEDLVVVELWSDEENPKEETS